MADTKLDDRQRHVLRLADRDADQDGWSTVSKTVWPWVQDIPAELLEKVPTKTGGKVRVTPTGKAILQYT